MLIAALPSGVFSQIAGDSANPADTSRKNDGTRHDPATLSSAYNLGRIPSGAIMDNITGWGQLDRYGCFLETFHIDAGSTGSGSLGITPILFLLPEDMVFFQLFPEIDAQWKIGNANRFFTSVSPLNLSFLLSSYGGGTGLEMPWTSLHNYRWRFLSRGGAIRLDPDQYDLAFLFGPQLNPGQISSDIGLVHTLNATNSPLRIFEINISPSIGISKNFQIAGNAGHSFVDSMVEMYHTSGHLKRDSSYIILNLRFRNENFFLGGSYNNYWSSYQKVIMRNSTNQIVVNSGFLLNDRIRDINEVRGDWDGFHSPTLGPNQLLSTVEVVVNPHTVFSDYHDGHYAVKKSSASELGIQQQNRYGLFNSVTLTEQFTANLSSRSIPEYDLDVTLSVNNVPLRTYGPESSSLDEYFHGRLVNRGQIIGSLTYSLPCFKRDVEYYYYPTTMYAGSLDLYSGMTDPFGGNKNFSIFSNALAAYGSPLLRDADVSCNVAWGITDIVSLKGCFTCDNIFYKESMNYPYYRPHCTHNLVYGWLSMLTFALKKTSRVSLAFADISQTDDGKYYYYDSSHRCKRYYMFLVLFQSTADKPMRKK